MAYEDEYRLPDWAELETAIPKSDHTYCIPGTEWLPKTDWSRDRIIANDD
jgi:hypothetical protein